MKSPTESSGPNSWRFCGQGTLQLLSQMRRIGANPHCEATPLLCTATAIVAVRASPSGLKFFRMTPSSIQRGRPPSIDARKFNRGCATSSKVLFSRHETETPHEHVTGDIGSGETPHPLLWVPHWLIIAYAGFAQLRRCAWTPGKKFSTGNPKTGHGRAIWRIGVTERPILDSDSA